jgi:hypothetical protein
MIPTVSLEEYFQKTVIPLRLSCNSTAGWPVVLSLWYIYEDGALYCATPKTAKVVKYLEADPRCAYEIASDSPPYCGVRGRALATIDEDRGLEILERLLIRYQGTTANNLAKMLLRRSQVEVAIRITPERYHTWNFSSRMDDITKSKNGRVCPE